MGISKSLKPLKAHLESSLRSLVIPDETDSRKPWRFAFTIVGILLFLAWLIYSIILIYKSSTNPSVAITYSNFEQFNFPVLVVCNGDLHNFDFSNQTCDPAGTCYETSLPSNVVSKDGRYSTAEILESCTQISFSSISVVTDFRFFTLNVTSYASGQKQGSGGYDPTGLVVATATAPNQFYLRLVFHDGPVTESDNVVDFSTTVWVWPGWTALFVQLTKYVDINDNVEWDFGGVPQSFPDTTPVVETTDTRTVQIQYQARTFRYSIFTAYPTYTWWTLISTVGSALACTVGLIIYIVGAPERQYTLNLFDVVLMVKTRVDRHRRNSRPESESESDSVDPRPSRTKPGKEDHNPEVTYLPVSMTAPSNGLSLQHRDATQAHSESFDRGSSHSVARV